MMDRAVEARRGGAREFLVTVVALAVLGGSAATHSVAVAYDELELDTKSQFSHIRIRRTDNIRSLIFVRDSGQEVAETHLDLNKPHDLITAYTRFMFMSYVFRARQDKVLIVGLGGGTMVHFLRHYDPNAEIDVVEIDPVIIKLGRQFFGVDSETKVNILNEDAFRYFAKATARYDVIYMDAFLKPSRETDGTGVPLKLKAIDFYKQLQQLLKPAGLVVFNLNPHPGTKDDLATIASAFPQVYVYRLTDSSGYVAVASTNPERQTPAAIAGKAKELDRRFRATFSFERMATRLLPAR